MGKMARIVFALLLACGAATARAETYPDRPIRMIVSIAAGSVTDVIMRTAAVELTPLLGGQPLVIENRGGASGIVAAQACAQAAPDGYTLCVIYHSTMSYNPLLFDHLPYDPERDLVPVARLFFLNEGLFVSTELGVNSVAELKMMAQTEGRPAQLRHARRRFLPRPVSALAEQPVGHQNRRRAVQRRRPGGAGARRQSGAAYPLRHRKFPRLGQSRQGQGAGGIGRQALAAFAGRTDLGRGRARRLSGPRLVGTSDAEGHAAGVGRQGQRRSSSRCSAIRNSPRSWTSRRWCRRRPRRRASSRS